MKEVKKDQLISLSRTKIFYGLYQNDVAILIQNAFPTIEKYIDHVHTINGIPLSVPTDLQNEIENLFKNMIDLKNRGTNLFFADIDKLKEKMLNELNQN